MSRPDDAFLAQLRATFRAEAEEQVNAVESGLEAIGAARDAEWRPELVETVFRAVHSLKGTRHVADIRNFGLAAGFTLEAVPGEPAKRPYEVAMKCLDGGFYVRYGGDTIQLAPPFFVEKSEIDKLVSVLGDALNATA